MVGSSRCRMQVCKHALGLWETRPRCAFNFVLNEFYEDICLYVLFEVICFQEAFSYFVCLRWWILKIRGANTGEILCKDWCVHSAKVSSLFWSYVKTLLPKRERERESDPCRVLHAVLVLTAHAQCSACHAAAFTWPCNGMLMILVQVRAEGVWRRALANIRSGMHMFYICTLRVSTERRWPRDHVWRTSSFKLFFALGRLTKTFVLPKYRIPRSHTWVPRTLSKSNNTHVDAYVAVCAIQPLWFSCRTRWSRMPSALDCTVQNKRRVWYATASAAAILSMWRFQET